MEKLEIQDVSKIIDRRLMLIKMDIENTTRYSFAYSFDFDHENRVIKITVEIFTELQEVTAMCDSIGGNERKYIECVEEKVSEVNNKYAFRSRIVIENDYIKILSREMPCAGDYCIVGGGFDITIRYVDPYTLMKSLDIIEDVINLYFYL